MTETTLTGTARGPALAYGLGYAGAAFIPLLLVVAWLVPELAVTVRSVSASYGALILSFLGGIHWGFAVAGRSSRPNVTYVASVLPSLWAVIAVSVPRVWGTSLLLLGFVAWLAYEWQARETCDYPDWYWPLRVRLSACLCGGLVLVLLI